MKTLLTFLLLSLLTLSCEKDQTNQRETCYKGRYIGEGCWPVIQLLEPFDGSIPRSQYGVYEQAVSTESLPDKYKDGKPFYFTISKVDSNRIYLTYCIPTKYFITISNLSNSACILSEN